MESLPFSRCQRLRAGIAVTMTHRWRPIALIWCALLIWTVPVPARGAQIIATPDHDLSVIKIQGDIVRGDYRKFTSAASQVPSAQTTLVMLESTGGVLLDALQIG